MSNYCWEELPDTLHDFSGRIVAGTDTINGTGACSVKFYDEPDLDDGDMVFFLMRPPQVRALAAYLSNVADSADDAYHKERCGCEKAECDYSHAP